MNDVLAMAVFREHERREARRNAAGGMAMNFTIHAEEQRVADLQRALRRVDRDGWKHLAPQRGQAGHARPIRPRLAAALMALADRLDPATTVAVRPGA